MNTKTTILVIRGETGGSRTRCVARWSVSGFTLFIAQPRSAEAENVAVVICIIAGFRYLGGGIVAGRCSKLIPNNRVNPDR
jgi:hypothetical protein